MHHYHHRAFYLGVLSVAMIVVGLLALNFPVYIDDFDQFGFQIKCGTGYFANLTQAAEAGGDYPGQCETALMLRRLWTIPLIAFGSILLAVVVFVAATVWGRESVFGEDPPPDLGSPPVSTPEQPALQRRLGIADAVTIGLGVDDRRRDLRGTGACGGRGGIGPAHRVGGRRRRRLLQCDVVGAAGRAVSAVGRNLRLWPRAARRILGLHRRAGASSSARQRRVPPWR